MLFKWLLSSYLFVDTLYSIQQVLLTCIRDIAFKTILFPLVAANLQQNSGYKQL